MGLKELKILGPDRIVKTKDWRYLFSPEDLEAAVDPEKILEVKLERPMMFRSRRNATVTMASSKTWGKKGRSYAVSISGIPSDTDDEWNPNSFYCPCDKSLRERKTCVHEAAALLALEEENGGPFIVKESDWRYRERMKKEEQYRKEMEYREGLEKGNRSFFPVSKILTVKQQGLVLYDLKKAISEYVTSEWAARESKKMSSSRVHVREIELRSGKKYLAANYR